MLVAVTAAVREPVPGWVDNLNGPTGLLVGAGKGLLRTLHCHRDMVADLIPVDVCINLLISVAWRTAAAPSAAPSAAPAAAPAAASASSCGSSEVVVYNCVSGAQNPITWGMLEDIGLSHLRKNPYNNVLWYPGGSFKSSRAYNEFCFFTLHVVPAHILDAVARATGKKPM